MTRNKTNKKIEHKSLVHVLEDCVLAMEEQGQTEQDIFSLVNMILRGFIRGGEITEEYKQLAEQAIQHRQLAEQAQNQFGLVDKFGSRIGS